MPNPASVAAAATISTGAVVCAAVAFEVFVFRPWRRENWPDGVKAGLQREWDGLCSDVRNGLWEMRSEFEQQRQRSHEPVPGSSNYGGGGLGSGGNDSTTALFDRDEDDSRTRDNNDRFRNEMEEIEMQQRQQLDRMRAELAESAAAASSGAEQGLRARQPYRDDEPEQGEAAPKTDVLVDVSAPAVASPANTSSQELQFPMADHSGIISAHARPNSTAGEDGTRSPTATERSWAAPRSEAAASSAAQSDPFSLVQAPSESGLSRTSNNDDDDNDSNIVDVRSPDVMSAGRSQGTVSDDDWLALDDVMTSSSAAGDASPQGSPRGANRDAAASSQQFSSSVGTIVPH